MQLNKLITFDMSFSYSMIKERNLKAALFSRNLDGYFSKVISVHPLAGLFNDSTEKYGSPDIHYVSDDHIFIEGKIGWSSWLKWIFPINFLIAQVVMIFQLIRLCKKENISVIKIGDPYYLGIIGLILKFFCKIPLVIRVCFRYDEIFKKTGRAVMPKLFRYRWIEKFIEKIVLQRCDLVAGANEDNMNYGIENGANREKCTVFRYGNLLDPLHWEHPAKRDTADNEIKELGLENKIFISTIARLEPMKYVEHVIYTIEELRERGHDVYGLIIGDGSLREEFERLAIAKKLKSFIKFPGNCRQEWIAKVLPKSTLILSPHMGRALTEAALSGVPIVGYDYDWQREVLINNKTGCLVEHQNWNEMANEAEKILNDQTFAKMLGKNVREHIEKMMDPINLNAHEISYYNRLINS